MRFRKRRSILIKRKYIRIIVPILAAIIVLVVILSVSAASRVKQEKEQAIDNIVSLGVVNVGLRGDIGSLCTYNEETHEFEGLEKDVADEINRRLFGEDILVNYVSVNSQTKDAMVRVGDLDFALGASINVKTSGVCFSSSYYADGSAFLVREGDMVSQQELKGRSIAVVQGSYAAGDSETDEKMNRLESYLKANEIEASVKMYASYPEAMDALRTGFVGSVCANEVFLKRFGKKGMLILPERFMPNRYCLAVSKTNGRLCDVLSDTIKEMKTDGTLDKLIKKWNLVNYASLEE